MIANAQGVRDSRQRRVHRTDAREETRIHDVEIIQLMGFAVYIQHRILWIRAEPTSAGLMANARDRNVFIQIERIWNEMRMQVQQTEHRL